MRIHRASDMGFCFGVRRAVDMMKEAAANGTRVTTLGQVVHNPQVVAELEHTGIMVKNDRSADDVHTDTVAITAHGVGETVVRDIEARGLSVIDTTCQFVSRSQRAARNSGRARLHGRHLRRPNPSGGQGRARLVPGARNRGQGRITRGFARLSAGEDRRHLADNAHAGALRGIRLQPDARAHRPDHRDPGSERALQRHDLATGRDQRLDAGCRP